MSNDYFNASGTFVTGTRARGVDVETEFDAVAAGLDKLPSEAEFKRGKINYGVDSGTADAYVVTLPYIPASLVDGQEVFFKALYANTGAATINVNSLGAKSLKRQTGSVLAANDITANKFVYCRYNATADFFELSSMLGIWAAIDHTHGAGGTVFSVVADVAALGTGGTDGEVKICADDGNSYVWNATGVKWRVRDNNKYATADLPTATVYTITTGTRVYDITTSQDKFWNGSAWAVAWESPMSVSIGGTGATTLTDHGILVGSGAGAVAPLAAATNGQIPIGSAGADPVLATLTGATNQVTVTNAAGSITLSTPQDIHTGASPTFVDVNSSGGALNAVINQSAATTSEVTTARGSLASVDARLDITLNEDGTLKNSIVTLAKLLDGLLTADVAGRSKMADLFVTTEKINNMAGSKLTGNAPASFVTAGGLAAGAVNATEVLADTIVTGAKQTKAITSSTSHALAYNAAWYPPAGFYYFFITYTGSPTVTFYVTINGIARAKTLVIAGSQQGSNGFHMWCDGSNMYFIQTVSGELATVQYITR
ncbi:MAG: hypothetical protein QME44_01720 [Thermodesulfobacteriota bacterium]|nr:hypothetical protein [Thermodesulfobacteriota bacterium]